MSEGNITEDDLQAYVDGRLDGARIAFRILSGTKS